jgi:redox-sensitive bicupin YhaK (pirin superfamily)
MGLQTVTWLIAGEVLHRDSLGSEQLIRPGQLNLMTAGHGIAHAEDATDHDAELQGIQLWIAQPGATRHGPPAFDHLAELPTADLGGATATVLIGAFEAAQSVARRDTELVGLELTLHDQTTVPLRLDFEYALIVLAGSLLVEGELLSAGALGYLPHGRDEIVLDVTGETTAMLLGGVPLGEEILMWWNFVARSRDEIDAADRSWELDDGRFGTVASSLERIVSRRPPWQRR